MGAKIFDKNEKVPTPALLGAWELSDTEPLSLVSAKSIFHEYSRTLEA